MRMGCLRIDVLSNHSRVPISSCAVSHGNELVLCNTLSGPSLFPSVGMHTGVEDRRCSGSLVLMDKKHGSIIKVFKGYVNESYGTECSFLTPDDRYVCTGSEDGCLYVYDILSGECVYTHACHEDHISSVSIHEVSSNTASPANIVHVCTASYDHTAKIFQCQL